MQLHDAIPDAIERVLAWGVPDESLPGALSAEATHLANRCPDEPDDSD
jgi:hypothetical protein